MTLSRIARNFLLNLGYATGPDFLIIGAQKAGTSALHTMLNMHPMIKSAGTKEIHYFDDDAWYNRGKVWQYHSFFPLPHSKKRSTLAFEATPMYLYHPQVPARLHRYNPNLKLIITLREPASRAFSAWTMYYHHISDGPNREYKEFKKFDELIESELALFGKRSFTENPKGYIERGIYHEQVSRLLGFFPKEQVLILENQDSLHHWDHTRERILTFLELPQLEIPLVKTHEGRVKEKSQYKDTLLVLKKFYRPFNEALYELIGRDFGWNEDAGPSD